LRERLFVWMEQTNDPARRLFQNRLRCYGEHLKLQSHKDRVGQHPG
jgi:hypothetical protein